MRTWLSKANGYVTEKPNDAFTGVFTDAGEMIYEGDLITVTRILTRYKGKYNKYNCVSESEYNDPKKWETVERTYRAKVHYDNGRFYINSLPPIEIYHDMNCTGRYVTYKINF